MKASSTKIIIACIGAAATIVAAIIQSNKNNKINKADITLINKSKGTSVSSVNNTSEHQRQISNHDTANDNIAKTKKFKPIKNSSTTSHNHGPMQTNIGDHNTNINTVNGTININQTTQP